MLGSHVSAKSSNFFNKGRLLLWASTSTFPVYADYIKYYRIQLEYALATDARSTPLATITLIWFQLKKPLDVCSQL